MQSAVLSSHVVCPSDVCPSVTFVYHDHIGWKSWKLIARTITPNIFALRSPEVTHLLAGEHRDIWGRKCSFNTCVHNVRLNWVNQESRDLSWRCGCLFTFVGASRGHLCDSTASLFSLYTVPDNFCFTVAEYFATRRLHSVVDFPSLLSSRNYR